MWRPIKRQDIRRGLAVNAFGTNDQSPYSISTIISTEPHGSGDACKASDNYIRLARPMAFASEHADNNQPMLHAEVYEISIAKLLEVGIVWEDRDNQEPRTFTT